MISRGWQNVLTLRLQADGFHEIEADVDDSSTLVDNDESVVEQFNAIREDDNTSEMTHSVAVNLYPATARMPQLTIVVIDTVPIELKRSGWCGVGSSMSRRQTCCW